jgi:cell division protein FtsA
LHATGVGLLLHGAKASGVRASGATGVVGGDLVGKLRGWFNRNF